MKQSRFFFLFSVFGLFILASCSSSSVQQQSPQSSITQTQQGIQVGVNIYDPNSKSQQESPIHQGTVTVLSPDLSLPLKSPAIVHGTVSGVYFSEGVFPVVLVDIQGKELARTLAHADSEWMTTDVVPFTAELSFQVAKKTQASLIFQKDNPSGLPENDFSQSFVVSLE